MAAPKKANKTIHRDSLTDVWQKHGPTGTGLLKSAGHINRRIVPSGLLALDAIMTKYGVPVGRWTSLFGDYNTAKSTTTYRTIANAWALYGMPAVIVDTESRYEPDVAELNGVEVDNGDAVMLSQWEPLDPRLSEKALAEKQTATIQSIAALIRDFSNDPRVIEWIDRDTLQPCEDDNPNRTYRGGVFVIDSLNAFMTKEKEEVLPDAASTLSFAVPKIISQASGEWMGRINARNMILMTTTQVRDNVQMMGGGGGGWTVPMGKAAKFFPSHIVEYKYVGKQEGDEGLDGRTIRLTMVKNTAGRFNYAREFILTSGFGPDDVREVLEFGIALGLYEQNGAFYRVWNPVTGERMTFQGIKKAREYFNANPELLMGCRENVRSKMIEKLEATEETEDASDNAGREDTPGE